MASIQHDPADIHARLSAERSAAQGRVTSLQADIAALMAASADANNDDEHDPEGATIAFERAQLQALQRAAETHLNQVDQALDRLAQGEYGRCRTCGVEIPPERLAILPTADSCVGCAAADPGLGSG
jgi:RNA polymerase-binding transcription factor DksA